MAQYVDVNGVSTWNDERGEGDPLVLLHGGPTDSRDFGGNLDALPSRFPILLPHRRRHGHTADAEAPITIEVRRHASEALGARLSQARSPDAVRTESAVGGCTLGCQTQPSWAIALRVPAAGCPDAELGQPTSGRSNALACWQQQRKTAYLHSCQAC